MKKSQDVEVGNFAKVHCWVARSDFPVKGKDVHCDGMNMFGQAINPLALASHVTNKEWNQRGTRSKLLMETCMNTILGNNNNYGINISQDMIRKRKYPKQNNRPVEEEREEKR